MKVFITGATGFIGRHVAARVGGAHELVCLVRSRAKAEVLRGLGHSTVLGDVRDKSSLVAGMRGCDCAVNLGNLYSMWEPDPRIFWAVNVEGTRKVMEAALECGVRRVVHVSTAAVYGKPREVPFNEESVPGPVRFSEYARSKYEGDLIAWGLHRDRGLPLVSIHPGAVVGPGDDKPTGRYLRDLAKGKMPVAVFVGTVLTYVHVRDVAEAIARALERDSALGRRYLLGKYRHTFAEINEMVCRAAGKRPPRLRLPNVVTMATAAVLTAASRVTKKPPPLGMSWDQANTALHGLQFDGGRAERELGITYTPIEAAIHEFVEWLGG